MKSGFVQKRCPKCGGNIYLDRDYFGWYEQCLQCSHTRYLETIVQVQERVSNEGNPGQAEGSAEVESINNSILENGEVYPINKMLLTEVHDE